MLELYIHSEDENTHKSQNQRELRRGHLNAQSIFKDLK